MGDYFLDAISADIESLHIYAGIHRVKFGFHTLHAKRFPYTIYYKLKDDIVKIYAILDDRQNPTTTKDRLKR